MDAIGENFAVSGGDEEIVDALSMLDLPWTPLRETDLFGHVEGCLPTGKLLAVMAHIRSVEDADPERASQLVEVYLRHADGIPSANVFSIGIYDEDAEQLEAYRAAAG